MIDKFKKLNMTQCLKTKGFKKHAQNIVKYQKISVKCIFRRKIYFFISAYKINL